MCQAGHMAEDLRSVTVNRLDTGVYEATNSRGGRLRFGSRADDDFTPVELLLAALAGCSAVDVDQVTSRRATPDRFEVVVTAAVESGGAGKSLRDIVVAFDLAFPEGAEGDTARTLAPRALQISHDRTCTVSRTVQTGVPVRMDLTTG